MISASHNPFYDNGIKLINSAGEKMREDVISEIEKYLDGETGEIPYATTEKIGCTVDYTAGRNRYMGYLMSLAIYSFKGIRVGLDADIVIYNPEKEFTITNDKMHGDTDHTIWEGIELKGYPEATYCRGNLVFKDGEFLGKRGAGKRVKCHKLHFDGPSL